MQHQRQLFEKKKKKSVDTMKVNAVQCWFGPHWLKTWNLKSESFFFGETIFLRVMVFPKRTYQIRGPIYSSQVSLQSRQGHFW